MRTNCEICNKAIAEKEIAFTVVALVQTINAKPRRAKSASVRGVCSGCMGSALMRRRVVEKLADAVAVAALRMVPAYAGPVVSPEGITLHPSQ